MQIQISWLLQKPTDLDLHCLQWQGISGFSRTRVNELVSGQNVNCSSIKISVTGTFAEKNFIFFFSAKILVSMPYLKIKVLTMLPTTSLILNNWALYERFIFCKTRGPSGPEIAHLD